MHHRKALVLLTVLVSAFAFSPEASSEYYEGYTLIAKPNSTQTKLLDESNQTVWNWVHNRMGGYSSYLLPDGNLLRPAYGGSSDLFGGAVAGVVQSWSPEGDLDWEFIYASNSYRTHHDIEPLPNGNVLLTAWEVKTGAEAVQAGLDHTAEIWPDHIIEVEPVGSSGGNIVWEWHAWDHLVQDHDPSKDNFGVVPDHPELLDINLDGEGGGPGSADWLHVNGISYDPVYDQIAITSHTLNEVWVIDHSTTTAEAAGHSGGNSGMGGDILYRWGSPSNYDRPGSQIFHVVHCPFWIPENCPGAGNLMAYNNGEGTGISTIVELELPRDGYGYFLEAGEAYGPDSPVWTYSAPGFYSNHLGGCQRLPNGNTMIAESTSGYLFEVDASSATQWSYAASGEYARVLRYGVSYAGLEPLGLQVDAPESPSIAQYLSQNYPNPFNPKTTIVYRLPQEGRVSLKIYDMEGRVLRTLVEGVQEAGEHSRVFNAEGLASGIYIYKLEAAGISETRRLALLQ